MNLVEIEYFDATCLSCGKRASDILERLLIPGETARDAMGHQQWCNCLTSPEYEVVKMQQAVCDRCGFHATDYGNGCPRSESRGFLV